MEAVGARFDGSWVVRERPGHGAAMRVFCLPPAGGGAGGYRGWGALAPALDVVAIELPGHGRRLAEPPTESMTLLVQSLASALEPWLTDPPYTLFGHSMGGLVAFELARELRRRCLPPPSHLVVSAVAAPSVRTRPERTPHPCTDADLTAELRRLGGTPEAVLREPELLDLLLPILRADLKLCTDYRFREEAALDCPITAMGGADDPTVAPDTLFGWAGHTTAGFDRIVLPGGHFYLDAHPVAVLNLLARCPAPSTGSEVRDAAG